MGSMSSPPLICDLPSIVSADDWTWSQLAAKGI